MMSASDRAEVCSFTCGFIACAFSMICFPSGVVLAIELSIADSRGSFAALAVEVPGFSLQAATARASTKTAARPEDVLNIASLLPHRAIAGPDGFIRPAGIAGP